MMIFFSIVKEFVPMLPAELLSDLPVNDPIIVTAHGQNHVVGVNRVRVSGGYVYRLVQADWDAVLEHMHLEAGSFIVFTKETINQFRLMAFDNDGSPAMNVNFHGATSLLRIQQTLDFWEESK